MVLFTHDVKICQKDQRCRWQKWAKNVRINCMASSAYGSRNVYPVAHYVPPTVFQHAHLWVPTLLHPTVRFFSIPILGYVPCCTYLLQLMMTSSGWTRLFSIPILGCVPRPRKSPGGSIRKLPIFSLCPSMTQKPYSSTIAAFSSLSFCIN